VAKPLLYRSAPVSLEATNLQRKTVSNICTIKSTSVSANLVVALVSESLLEKSAQVGDQLDRGGNEVAILYFLERISAEAKKEGGAVVTMNGNHETLNVAARYRYATVEVILHLLCSKKEDTLL